MPIRSPKNKLADLGYLRKKLLSLSQRLSQKKKYKIRVLVDTQGSFRISYSPLKEVKTEVLVKLSSKKTDPSDIFLYHKTTQRAFYEEERKKALSEGFFEVIFTNKRGELTEGSISNIFVVNKNKIYTPSLSSGLLPGVLREHLLKTKKVQEKVLYLKDIFEAKEVFIGNSLRGLLKAKIILVDADPFVRYKRAKARRRKGFAKTYEQFLYEEALENAEFDFHKTKKMANFKIDNSGSIKEMEKQIDKIAKKLKLKKH